LQESVYGLRCGILNSAEPAHDKDSIPTARAVGKPAMRTDRLRRGMRRPRHHTQKTNIHGRIAQAVSISERPAAAEDRALPGHWEGDLLFGGKNSQIATLVERQSRYLMLAKVDSKDTQTVVNALIKHAHKLPHELYK
jgi:IS30 family transposase